MNYRIAKKIDNDPFWYSRPQVKRADARVRKRKKLSTYGILIRKTLALCRNPSKEGWLVLREEVLNSKHLKGVDYMPYLLSWAKELSSEGKTEINLACQTEEDVEYHLSYCSDRWNHPYKVWQIDRFYGMGPTFKELVEDPSPGYYP